MTFNTNKVKEILLAGNYISSKDLAQAEIQSASRHVSLVDYLLSSRIITNDLLGQAIAEYFKVDYADLNSNPPEASQVLRIPEAWAKKYRVVIFQEDADIITIASDDPQGMLLTTLAPLFPAKKIILVYSLPQDIDAAFVKYKKILRFALSKLSM